MSHRTSKQNDLRVCTNHHLLVYRQTHYPLFSNVIHRPNKKTSFTLNGFIQRIHTHTYIYTYTHDQFPLADVYVIPIAYKEMGFLNKTINTVFNWLVYRLSKQIVM